MTARHPGNPGAEGATCGFCPASRLQLLSTDRKAPQAAAESGCFLRRLPANSTITGEREEVRLVGFVLEGVLRLSRTLPDGHRQVLGILMPPDHFGGTFAAVSPFAIESATDAVLCCRERGAFEAMLHDSQAKEHAMLLNTLSELDAAREWMMVLGYHAVRCRIAAFLQILLRRSAADRPGSDGPVRVQIPIGRRDMASYLGTRVETLSRGFRVLARDGVIALETAQIVRIESLERLLAVTGTDEFLRPATLTNMRRSGAAPPVDIETLQTKLRSGSGRLQDRG